ncbi:MAG: DUF1553 domain-containing protein [Planctomycetaceae bacterium]|nr:DUF1553 domain-containing protein [Planctomycetaceae bacterium]
MNDLHSFTLRQFIVLLLVFCAPLALSGADQPTPDQIRFFESKIRPLLADNCYDCHGELLQESDLRLDTLKGMLTGGKAGPALIPGKTKSSLIVTAVTYRDNELKMPPQEKLTDAQIADLTKWVEMGAPHPDTGKVKVEHKSSIDLEQGRQHWAFQPPAKPDLPAVSHPASVKTPVDAFLLARLDEKNITPVPLADKRTLIRRATFDLIGLPPTPAEVESFVNDTSPDAFARVIDRLLESPHYGERWGRHWLDVVRYADSNGLDENIAHGNAWRYRDYVVNSLNADKPYDQFLTEQLAGDLLDAEGNFSRRRENLIATGYLVLGPKVLAEVDEAKMEMDIVDEQLDTIGRGLMGLTLGCARCHDHKFDPIAQQDYYSLAGIFKSTRAMESFTKIAKWNENLIATDEQIEQKEQHEQKIADQKTEINNLIAAAKKKLPEPTGETVPKDLEKRFPEETQAQLKELRDELKQLEETLPELPTAMGVKEGDIADTHIHLRGSHLTLGAEVPRQFPVVMAGTDQPPIPDDQSGRLQFANWLTEDDHPLTARVMVNRVWRWHFGKGLVPTVDNFGLRGEKPTHPELLDWLAVHFVEEGWSLKSLHRTIMLSAAYQRQSRYDESAAAVDPENRLYWRYDLHRLDAETIRDAMLAVSGTLDPTMGGSLVPVKNREFFFNHTSEDKASYEDIRRRSIYVPVVRNHLYDMFKLFDYTDASVLNGNRESSTIAPQALMLMNSDLMSKLSSATADRLLATEQSSQERIQNLFLMAYARPATDEESQKLENYLLQLERLAARNDSTADPTHKAWQMICQSVLASSEFLYVR